MTGCYNDLTGEPLQDLDEAIAKLGVRKIYRLVCHSDYDLIYTPMVVSSRAIHGFCLRGAGEHIFAHAYDDNCFGCRAVAVVAYSPDEDQMGH